MKKTANTVATAMGVDLSPSLHLTVKDLPDIKNWKVGSTYDVTMKIKQTGMQEGGWDGKQPLSADFKVVSVKSTTSSDDDYDD